MAEIKMDLSEYEVLIENKNLYKQGLEREKEKNFNLWKIKHVLKNKKTWFISIPKAIQISKLLNLN